MRKLWKKFCKLIGWWTAYQFCAMITKNGATTYIDNTVLIRPWLSHGEGYDVLRKYIKEEMEKETGPLENTPVILSLTRIGW